MEEKQYTIEEMFCGMPEVLKYFQDLESEVTNYRKTRWARASKERLILRNRELLNTMRNMTQTDVRILYYIRKLSDHNFTRFYFIFKELFRTECKLKNLASGKTEFFDVLDLSKP